MIHNIRVSFTLFRLGSNGTWTYILPADDRFFHRGTRRAGLWVLVLAWARWAGRIILLKASFNSAFFIAPSPVFLCFTRLKRVTCIKKKSGFINYRVSRRQTSSRQARFVIKRKHVCDAIVCVFFKTCVYVWIIEVSDDVVDGKAEPHKRK